MRSLNRKNIELPLDLHQRLKVQANRQRRTTATLAAMAVEEWLKREESSMSFSTIVDVYAEFEEYFGSEHPEWSRDQLQEWLFANGHTRYEGIDHAVLDAAYAACIAEITDPA